MAGIATLGLSIILLGIWTLGKNWAPSVSGVRKDAALITSSPYDIVRHPIYLGAFIFLIALSLVSANLVIILPTIAILTLLYASIDEEEAMLVDRFGEQYLEYMKRTPRFIPKFKHEYSTK
jgi:protein-S-isoprenylcysteine O-methyltransferase Ste14